MTVDPVVDALEALAPTLEASPNVFVAFSGGLDSTVLLHAAQRVFTHRLRALHAHHGLQQAAQDWLSHCQRVCADWQVSLESVQLDVTLDGRGVEAAARDARYAWFTSRLKAGDALLLAHHLDDQAETLLLRLLRGAGPDGLGAMPPQRSIGQAMLYRPLLALPRAELEVYARRHGLTWVEDPTNSDERLDRSYLRTRVMPLLEERWPGYRRTFARSADLLRAQAAGRLVHTPTTVHAVTGEVGFALASLVPGERADAVRAWLREHGLTMPSQARLTEFLRQLEQGRGASLRTREYCLSRFGDAVYCHAPEAPGLATAQALAADGRYAHPALGRVQVAGLEGLPVGPLALRCRRAGDRIAAPGGGHRSLKQIFQEARVPVWWRERVPLLVQRATGQGGGDDKETILAVGPFAFAPAAQAAGIVLNWEPPTPPGA